MHHRNRLAKASGLGFILSFTGSSASTTTTNYEYDDLGRATKVESVNSTLTTYAYDLADNRTNKTISVDPCNFPNAKLSDMTVIRVSTASYKPATSNCVQTLNSAGVYANAGRWLATGLSANNYSIRAISTSTTACSGFYMGTWFPAYYVSGWSISSSGTNGATCTFRMEVSLSSNTSVVLASANITLTATAR